MKAIKKTSARPPLLADQEAASQPDAVASIRRGLAQVRKVEGRPADEVLRKDASWHSLRGALKEVFAENGGGKAYLRAERSNFHPTKERE